MLARFLHGFVRPFHASKATSVHRHIGPFLLLPPLYFFLNRRIDLLVIIGERRRACDRATMEMHILPFVVPLVPYAALLALMGVRYSLSEKICNRIFSNLCKFSGFVRDLQSKCKILLYELVSSVIPCRRSFSNRSNLCLDHYFILFYHESSYLFISNNYES